MGNHYIRFLDHLKDYATKMDPSEKNWRESIFNDLTSNGKQIVVTEIPPRKIDFPSIGLCGDIYFCEAGEDNNRKDTLVIYRLYSADVRLPEIEPKKYDGKFALISAKEQPDENFDNINPIMNLFVKKEEYVRSKKRHSSEASAALIKALSGFENDARGKWFPSGKKSNIDLDRKSSLNKMQNIWTVYGLNQYIEVTERQKLILGKRIHPPELTDEVFFGLIDRFDVSLLNHLAITASESLHSVIDILSTLPLHEQNRSTIWAAFAKSLSTTELRKELTTLIPQIGVFEGDDFDAWLHIIQNVMRYIGKQHKDDFLIQAVENAEQEADTYQYILEWTERLQFPKNDSEVNYDQKHNKEEIFKDAKNETQPYLIKYKKLDIDNVHKTNKGIDINERRKPSKDTISRIEEWIVKNHLPHLDEFKNLRKEIMLSGQKIEDEIEKCKTIIEVENIIKSFNHLDNKFKEYFSIFPNTAILKKEYEKGFKHFLPIHEALGNISFQLIEKGTTPNDLKEINEIYLNFDLLDILPYWLWSESEFLEQKLKNIQPDEKILLLSNPLVRERIKKCISVVYEENIKELKNIFLQIPEPNIGASIEEHYISTIKEQLKYKELFKKYDKNYHVWMKSVIMEGVLEEELIDLADRIDFIKERIGETEFIEFINKLTNFSNVSKMENYLDLFESSIEFHEKVYDSANNIPFSMLEIWINKNKDMILSGNRYSDEEIELSLEHNWVDHPRRKIKPLYFSYNNVDGDYGFVSLPVRFVIHFKPRALNLSLEYNVKAKLRESWPSLWEEPSPKYLRIPREKWRKLKDSYVFSFIVRIPLREPKEPRTKLTLQLIGIEEKTGKNIINSKSITWDDVEISKESITLHWPDGIQTDYVNAHPIGPQEHVKTIENRLISGSSFAIVSPRRFGKTTLAQYIEERAENLNLIIPPPILCKNVRDENQKTDLHSIWKEFSKHLQDQLGSAIKLNDNDLIPDSDAFNHIRRAAKNMAKDGIVLIIDEAQLFFQRKSGPILGTALKDKLELSWSKKDAKMSPLYIGLIGLPSLLEKIGANFKGFLSPVNIREFKESNLNTLIYKFTHKNLHTTLEAREKLSQKAGNLYILKTLLTELVNHVNNDKRNWICYDDVEEVIEALKSRLRLGQEPTLASYLRDILNEADDINFWKPRVCYPVAVALAKALFEREIYNLNPIINKVNDILNHWCIATGLDETIRPEDTKRRIYTKERVIEHIQKLEELGVFNRGAGFYSDILEAWLYGISQQFPFDSEDREALFAGALERITLPDGRELIHSGTETQGDLYRFSENQKNYAIRTIHLKTQNDRKKFHDTVEILKILKNLTEHREDGTAYIYNLRDIGIADNSTEGDTDGIIGVEIYQWIEGICLREKVSKLTPPIVAEIGYKLSKALKLIHSNGILHRDICPRNVILERKSTDPILIDFGLSRYITHEMRTIIKGDCTAPEINTVVPNWTKSADIYSLGKTLLKLLNPNSNNNDFLLRILNDCINDSSNHRPSAEDLFQYFYELMPKLNIQERHDKVWAVFCDKAKRDLDKIWFSEVLEKFKPRYISVSLGLHEEVFDRCAEIAQFLDFILEAFPNDTLKLSIISNKATETFKNKLANEECLHFMSKLRIERSHYDPKKSKRNILNQYKNPSDETIEKWAKRSADFIGNGLHLHSLPDLVDMFLSKSI